MSVAPAVVDIPTAPAGEAPLNSTWSMWSGKTVHDESASIEEYKKRLTRLSTFNTVEGFFRCYSFLPSGDAIPRDHNLFLMKGTSYPMWESFPNGGCWLLRIKKSSTNGMLASEGWEELLLAAIGEALDSHPDVVRGVALASRSADDVLSVWLNDASDEAALEAVGNSLVSLLKLRTYQSLRFKAHSAAMKDQSSYADAQVYILKTPIDTMMERQGRGRAHSVSKKNNNNNNNNNKGKKKGKKSIKSEEAGAPEAAEPKKKAAKKRANNNNKGKGKKAAGTPAPPASDKKEEKAAAPAPTPAAAGKGKGKKAAGAPPAEKQ